MKTFYVAITRVTTYRVLAETTEAAADAVLLHGEGLEIDQETMTHEVHEVLFGEHSDEAPSLVCPITGRVFTVGADGVTRGDEPSPQMQRAERDGLR